jgi:hypothetical protein
MEGWPGRNHPLDDADNPLTARLPGSQPVGIKKAE